MHAEQSKDKFTVTLSDMVFKPCISQLRPIVFLENLSQDIESRLVRSPGRFNLFLTLRIILSRVLNEKGSNFELSSDIEQLIFVLLIVPLQILNLDGSFAQERTDEAITEPLGQ